jgi:hypothetical protein
MYPNIKPLYLQLIFSQNQFIQKKKIHHKTADIMSLCLDLFKMGLNGTLWSAFNSIPFNTSLPLFFWHSNSGL